jgi:hypothetical protein
MKWHRTHIHMHDPLIGEAAASGLMEAIGAAYHRAGAPAGVKVFKQPNKHGDITYYLSPAAASLVRDRLVSHNAEPCEEPADLEGFWEVSL